MIINTPMYVSEDLRRLFYNREIGSRPTLGLRSRLHASLYSSVKRINEWDPVKTVNDTHHGGIFNFDFSPDGSILVAACEGKSILIFDPFNGSLIRSKNQAHTGCVNCVRFLDSRTFATCSDDTTVCLWDIRFMKQQVRTLNGHSHWVKSIEYAADRKLLVTSGFDGNICTWAINRYSENGTDFKTVFNTNGLMRSKLTPDASKLVVATSAGYLMIVHDLNLETMAEDLTGFKPEMYRMMQLFGNPISQAYNRNHVFTRKRNRVEMISDFNTEDDAEMITSLEIHPQGWCCVSRNNAKEDRSEWTSVHDIQDRGVYSTTTCGDLYAAQHRREGQETESDGDVGDEGSELPDLTADTADTEEAAQQDADSTTDPDVPSSPPEFNVSSTIERAMEHVRRQYPHLDLSLNLEQVNTSENQAEASDNTDSENQALGQSLDVPQGASQDTTANLLRRLLNRRTEQEVGEGSEGTSISGAVSNSSARQRYSFRISLRVSNREQNESGSPGLDVTSRQNIDRGGTGTSSLPENHSNPTSNSPTPTSEASDARVPPTHHSTDTLSNRGSGSGISESSQTSRLTSSQESSRRGFHDPVALFIRNGLNGREQTMIMVDRRVNTRRGKLSSDFKIKVHLNRPRLTHFVPEPNVGRGYIKEVCFSNDGRIIASPFGFGIRLLAFDPLCNELCDSLPSTVHSGQNGDWPSPVRLYEVADNMTHDIEVVTTKWSPTHPLVVSGCLNGKVDFHQPVF